LVEDIIVESIRIMGFDAFYLANNNDEARDLLYGEDPVKKFTTSFPLEMYMSNVMEYSGEREFFSKFGLEIKNNMEVILSKRSFSERVPQDTFTRPREGDLVYIPFGNGQGELFEIKFVEQNKDMMMLGRKYPYFYELQLEKFRYSNEIISTGQPEIDVIPSEDAYSITLQLGNLANANNANSYVYSEIVYQSNDGTSANAYTTAIAQTFTAGSGANPATLVVTNIAGVFLDNHIIYGKSSNAQYYLSTFDPLDPNVRNEVYDNKYIQNSANGIIDFSESNPFGLI
jgi:Virus neck protein